MGFFKAHRLAAAAAVALVALVVGGIAYATIPAASGTISGCYDTKTGALRVYDTSGGAIPGCAAKEAPLTWSQIGPQGPQGPQGPAGTAKAWARVDLNGNVTSSFGLGSATVTHPQTGVYCIGNLPFQPHVAVATGPTGLGTDPNTNTLVPTGWDVNVVASTLDLAANPNVTLAFCDPDTGPAVSQVRIYVANSSGLLNKGFSIFIDG
jgi:hypothetical protein